MPNYTRQNGILVPQGFSAEPALPPMVSEPHEFLAPLVEQWRQKLIKAHEAKKPFNTVAEQCDSFFSRDTRFMWQEPFKSRFLGSVESPRFQVTLNKAFELVALFGPYLFWKYPQVYIKSYDRPQLPPELFGDVENDQIAAMLFQQYQSETRTDTAHTESRNRLMEHYLNWSQKEQPGGGLAKDASLAITEALVKGRGCLWTESYQYPGSNRKLTMRKFRSVDRLLIDPDSRDPLLRDAKWISLEHDMPRWEMERLFGLPEGFMKGRGKWESAESLAVNRSDAAKRDRLNGKTFDRCIWYEIWSKGGVGTRLQAVDDINRTMLSGNLHGAFDSVVGDYAYLCVAGNVPFPLNAPSWRFRDAQTNQPLASDDEVKDMFQWRAAGYGPKFPCYLDDRWPCTLLDFYRNYASCWPIAPLGPALGELIVLNVLISAFTDQAYANRKQIIAYLESAAKDVQNALRGNDNPAFVGLNDTVNKSITDVIQYLNHPSMNKDLLDAIAYVSELFDKRTGLTEFMYAMTTTQNRTARETAAKEEKAAIRPEKMSNDVGDWLTDSAESEKFLASWVVAGQDLIPLLGRFGAHFWDELITSEDPETLVREMRATCEASDIRKPNRDRLLANIQEAMQFLLPVYKEYAEATGDTEPLNQFLSGLNRALEDNIVVPLGEWRPQASEEEMQMQQVMADLEQAKVEAETLQAQIEAQTKALELEKAQIETEAGGAEVLKKQMELAFDQEKHDQDLEHDEERHEQELFQDRQKFVQEALQRRAEGKAKVQQMRAEKAESGKGKAATNGSAT